MSERSDHGSDSGGRPRLLAAYCFCKGRAVIHATFRIIFPRTLILYLGLLSNSHI